MTTILRTFSFLRAFTATCRAFLLWSTLSAIWVLFTVRPFGSGSGRSQAARYRYPSLTDPGLFLSFARLAAYGDPSENRILTWVRKHGLLRKASPKSIFWELEEDVEQEVGRSVGREVLTLKAHQVNQAPMSVKEFREETRHAHMCLRVLESIRSNDIDSLRSRISLRQIDPSARLFSGR